MKKAKVFLTAIAVFTVVGGALAFKAQKLNGNLFCTTSPNSACAIDVTYTTVSITDPGVNLYCADKSLGANGCTTVSTQKRVTIDN